MTDDLRKRIEAINAAIERWKYAESFEGTRAAAADVTAATLEHFPEIIAALEAAERRPDVEAMVRKHWPAVTLKSFADAAARDCRALALCGPFLRDLAAALGEKR